MSLQPGRAAQLAVKRHGVGYRVSATQFLGAGIAPRVLPEGPIAILLRARRQLQVARSVVITLFLALVLTISSTSVLTHTLHEVRNLIPGSPETSFGQLGLPADRSPEHLAQGAGEREDPVCTSASQRVSGMGSKVGKTFFIVPEAISERQIEAPIPTHQPSPSVPEPDGEPLSQELLRRPPPVV